MQPVFKLAIDANKEAYDYTFKAVNNFQEKAGEAMKFAFDKSPVPPKAKDAALKTIDVYNSVVRSLLDAGKTGYENLVKTIVASQEQSERLTREYLDKSPLPEETKKAILAVLDLSKESSPRPRKVAEESDAAAEEIVDA
jgi:hypothetical protein